MVKNNLDNIEEIKFNAIFKLLNTEGNLAWEYNPFRNYKASENKYYFRNKFFNEKDLLNELYKDSKENRQELSTLINWDIFNQSNKLPNGIREDEDKPELYQKGQLSDFITKELNFDLTHPVDIIPLYSYDGSVNLIINDGKNSPKMINSRFSPIGKNTYKVIDRKGENDSNIYTEKTFDIDTSLYKVYKTIPKLHLIDVLEDGFLAVGNYHFYFKYVDSDNNETDIISESGMVSIFKGTSFGSISTGFRDENSNKSIRFKLSNLDTSYLYVYVYYTKSSADINENPITLAYKITLKFPIKEDSYIYINGNEPTQTISIDSLNTKYLLSVKIGTQTTCSNMLFFGNIKDNSLEYSNLQDLSLRFLPKIITKPYTKVEHNYEQSTFNTYADPKFIYNYLGYLNEEIYRFGIVYIMNDGSLSPVFNIRGIDLNNNPSYTKCDILNGNDRVYIKYDTDTGLIDKNTLENVYGIVKINSDKPEHENIFGIKIDILDNKQQLASELKKQKVRGYFFVRLKRKPIRLCQAYTIGVEEMSNLPVLCRNDKYIIERFVNNNMSLNAPFTDRLYKGDFSKIQKFGAICPEYDVNPAYYNEIFCGNEYKIKEIGLDNTLYNESSEIDRHFFRDSYDYTKSSYYLTSNVLGVEDDVKAVGLKEKIYSSKAGYAEEAFRFSFIEDKELTNKDNYIDHEGDLYNKDEKQPMKGRTPVNVVRGSYGPYLALSNYKKANSLINIYHPIVTSDLKELFEIRVNDKSSYYAVSDRYELNDSFNIDTIYRGDSYICTFTHRMNRNFQDPDTPTNTIIVEPDCWKWVFYPELKEGSNEYTKSLYSLAFNKINRSDVNAVKLGMWVTLPIVSNYNLNVRSVDNSRPDEEALVGHARLFYPNYGMDAATAYNTPDALVHNRGFHISVSSRYNFVLPDVPYYKNDFTNRISYSNVCVNDAIQNGFRTFLLINYRDYPKTYGLIIKLVELSGNLLIVFEHGIALAPINERVLAGEGQGGSLYINTSNVLPETLKILSDTFGSQWKDSIIKTPSGVYGVDTVAKKIWMTNGSTVKCITDFNLQEFLNNNITLTEREIEPIIGIRNVKTHYNKFKNDVMFTFYDNLEGFREKVWNLCFNELLGKFITFYSWIPSFSENIYNQFFTFDRNVSKNIAKLAMSLENSTWANGICVKDNIIKPNSEDIIFETDLFVKGVNSEDIKYTLYNDEFNNKLYFKIEGHKLLQHTEFPPKFEELIIPLNIQAVVGSKTYKTLIYLIREDDFSKLSTDFWQHGLAGIIDIKDEIKPTNWYGEEHPFEFEFVVADNPQYHKIFDNLLIISNNAEPESFHYEIIGDCYNFAKDKKNMFIRLEATKRLYSHNGSNIDYDDSYLDLKAEQRELGNGMYDKSTLFPLYYSRLDKLNTVEDSYNMQEETNKDFSALAGAEIVRYKKLDEFRIWNHAKAVNADEESRLRSNMQYKEDKWYVLINPITLVLANEDKWPNDKIPYELGMTPIPNDKNLDLTDLEFPEQRTYNNWNWTDNEIDEVKLKDKWIKIRIRYKGDKLAIIQAVKTLYSISYG